MNILKLQIQKYAQYVVKNQKTYSIKNMLDINIYPGDRIILYNKYGPKPRIAKFGKILRITDTSILTTLGIFDAHNIFISLHNYGNTKMSIIRNSTNKILEFNNSFISYYYNLWDSHLNKNKKYE